MSCMGRCVKHGCAFSARLIDGTRDEYCPECEIDHLRAALARLQQEREGLIALVKERGSLIVEDHHDYSMTGNKWCSVCGNSTGAAACFIVQHDPRCVVHWLPTQTQEPTR